jgi:hypothetical protein
MSKEHGNRTTKLKKCEFGRPRHNESENFIPSVWISEPVGFARLDEMLIFDRQRRMKSEGLRIIWIHRWFACCWYERIHHNSLKEDKKINT